MKICSENNQKKLVKLKKQKADNNIGPKKLIYILLNHIKLFFRGRNLIDVLRVIIILTYYGIGVNIKKVHHDL